jgi:hypothetical protein
MYPLSPEPVQIGRRMIAAQFSNWPQKATEFGKSVTKKKECPVMALSSVC